MPDKFKIATAVLAFALAYDTQVHYRNKKKFKKLQEEKKSLSTLLGISHLQVAYLAHLLDENDVPFTDFDRIVINDLTQ